MKLARAPAAPSALGAYERARRPATSALVPANRRHGPERVMTMIERCAPNGFATIDDVVGRGELQALVARYAHLAGFDVHELNTRASFGRNWSAPVLAGTGNARNMSTRE